MRKAFALVLSAAAAVTLHSAALARDEAADEKTEALWQEAKSLLEPAGINRQMFGVLNLWLEGQFHLGNCNKYLKADDVAFWRTWWEDTVVPTTQVGRYFLGMGTDMYNEGLNEGLQKSPSKELCQRTADSWFADMKLESAKGSPD